MKALLLFLLTTASLWAQPKTLLIRQVNLVDMSRGTIRPNTAVRIQAERIVAVGLHLKPQPGDSIVEAKGQFLMPGLWDMHVHIRQQEKLFFPLLIANGVTGVRDMHNPFRYNRIGHWRDSLNAPSVLAPRIGTVAGRIIDGYGDSRNLGFATVANAGEARQAVDLMKACGADFIKVYNDLSDAEYSAIAQQARRYGLSLAGHLPYGLPLDTILRGGLRSIEHMDDLPFYFSSQEAAIRQQLADSCHSLSAGGLARLVERAYSSYDSSQARQKAALINHYNTFVCPTLWVAASLSRAHFPASPQGKPLQKVPLPILNRWLPKQLAQYSLRDSALYEGYYQRALQQVNLLARCGVSLLAGTDASPIWEYIIPGYSLHFELALYVQAGLTPYQALRTATVNPARYLNREKDFGLVEPGMLADLILLQANPLIDIQHLEQIQAVILKGQYLSRSRLDGFVREAQMQAALK